MAPGLARTAAVLALALCVTSVTLLESVVPAKAAAANRPAWSPGDFWDYQGVASGRDVTLRFTILEWTTLDVNGTATGALHVRELFAETPAGSGGAPASVTTDTWLAADSLDLIFSSMRHSTGSVVNGTFDPPLNCLFFGPLFSIAFPLVVGRAWSRTTSIRVVTNGGPAFLSPFYSQGQATEERRVHVPAGDFDAIAINTTFSALAYTIAWYAEAVGSLVSFTAYLAALAPYGLTQATDGFPVQSSWNLTAYRYQAPAQAAGIVAIGLGVILVTAVAYVVMERRRRQQGGPAVGLPPPKP